MVYVKIVRRAVMLNDIIHTLQIIIALFLFGVIIDYPEQRRKKRKKACENGNHNFKKWQFQYEIHNGNDVWRKQCKNCKTVRETVDKLTPSTNEEGWKVKY